MIRLTLKEQPTVPLEAENLSPDVMLGLEHHAIRALPVFLGKRQHRLDDFFNVEGEAGDAAACRLAEASTGEGWVHGPNT